MSFTPFRKNIFQLEFIHKDKIKKNVAYVNFIILTSLYK